MFNDNLMYNFSTITFILICFFSNNALNAQYQYSFSSDDSRFTLKVTSIDLDDDSLKHKFKLELEINNFDSLGKYFRVDQDNDSGKIVINFSEMFWRNRDVDFLIGGCIEKVYPPICRPLTFFFKKIEPKQKILVEYIFDSGYDINYYINFFQLNFSFRYIKESRLPQKIYKENELLTLDFNTFYKYSTILNYNINEQNRNNNYDFKD